MQIWYACIKASDLKGQIVLKHSAMFIFSSVGIGMGSTYLFFQEWVLKDDDLQPSIYEIMHGIQNPQIIALWSSLVHNCSHITEQKMTLKWGMLFLFMPLQHLQVQPSVIYILNTKDFFPSSLDYGPKKNQGISSTLIFFTGLNHI